MLRKAHPEGRNAALRALLSRFAGARVVVVGDLVADEYVLGETDRVSREAPVLIVRYERSELKAGCAANAVMNLCALGAVVQPIGLVGEDALGQRLQALLAEAGADVRGVLRASGAETASKTRILAGGKNTRRQQIVRLDRDGPGAPVGALLVKLVAALRGAVRTADAVLISDYGLGVPQALAAELAQLSGKLPICADARYGLRGYANVALAKPNEIELEQAVGKRIGDDPRALEEAARALLGELGAANLLVTRGRSGMALVRPELPTVLLPAHGQREAVDVTGAGDTVMAATTLGLACGADALLAARLANVAGALVVAKPGTATVSAAELERELREADVAEGELLGVITTRPAAQALREAARARGALCAVANGAFNLLHVGHLRYLEAAKALVGPDGLLIVGVNSDASVRASKGPARPVIPEAERAELVAALRCVDLVVIFAEPTAAELLAALRPDLHAKGTDYSPESVPERALVASFGGRTVICGDAKEHSTSATVTALRARGEPE